MMMTKPYEAIPHPDWFWRHVEKAPSCWLWKGQQKGGYGRYESSPIRRQQAAHRVAFGLTYGYLPTWPWVLDHLCENKLCVNPSHLQVTTMQHNSMRGGKSVGAINKRKTHCPVGHPYGAYNVQILRRPSGKIARRCRECHRRSSEIRNRRLAEGRP